MFLNIILFIFITLVICFAINAFAQKIRLIDSPDGVRKRHKGDISLGGGLSLFLSGLCCYFIGQILFPNSLSFSSDLNNIIFASVIILLMGLVDDIKPLPISFRIIIQILASWVVILITDIYIRDLGDLIGFGNIYLGNLGIPITIFMVVGVCNAFNMMDGMDGLVALLSLISFSFLSFVAALSGQVPSLFFISNIILLIFLIFNLGILGKKYKMFLGDSGSMWLGFILAWCLVSQSQGESSSFHPVIALWVILLPLIDALSTFLNRLRSGKPIFSGDRNHIHYILTDKGLKKVKILFIFLVISVSSCSFAFYSVINSVPEVFLFYGFLTIWISYYLLIKYSYIKN